jgi:hypothetical protein
MDIFRFFDHVSENLVPRAFDKYKAWVFELLGQKIHSKVVRN